MAERGSDVDRAARDLKQGLLVAIPTETVYGLAANAFDEAAVAAIFAAKNRPRFDPLIVHLAHEPGPGTANLEDVAAAVPAWARALARAFWPGPLTLVLARTPRVPDLVTSGLDTVAVRVPDHPLTQRLLRGLAFPLAAPSANPFGYVSPTRAEHVLAQLGASVSYVLDGGPCAVGVESTIVAEQDGRPVILRQGGLAQEDIEAVTGPLAAARAASRPQAPGQLESHYAPAKPVYFGEGDCEARGHEPARCAAIGFDRPFGTARLQRLLAPTGDLALAARGLFAALRELDQAPDVAAIFACRFPESGLGRAINDRLRRAAAARGA
jgi:L-threonylcarbamoyladenylate synthase